MEAGGGGREARATSQHQMQFSRSIALPRPYESTVQLRCKLQTTRKKRKIQLCKKEEGYRTMRNGISLPRILRLVPISLLLLFVLLLPLTPHVRRCSLYGRSRRLLGVPGCTHRAGVEAEGGGGRQCVDGRSERGRMRREERRRFVLARSRSPVVLRGRERREFRRQGTLPCPLLTQDLPRVERICRRGGEDGGGVERGEHTRGVVP